MLSTSHILLISVVLVLLTVIGCEPTTDADLANTTISLYSSECAALRDEAREIRREGYLAGDKAELVREEAYKMMEEAYKMKVGVLETRIELETSMVETLALMRGQATATSLYIQEIRTTLGELDVKITLLEDKIDTKITELEDKVDTKISELEDKVDTGSENLTREIAQVRQTASIIKNRQKTWLSEVRLISLYKVTGGINEHSASHYSDLIVDGQFTHDGHTEGSMRTYSHTANDARDNKLWIELGGVFKIHKIQILNLRHCCQERLIGAHIYADDRLLGSVVEAKGSYEFFTNEDDPTYASRITLHQPLAKYTHILELQVWGSGPYSTDDMF